MSDVLPLRVRRSLGKFGADIAIARRKRELTVAMMAERLAIGRTTYLRLERGDPKVAIGAYAMALFVLGVGERFEDLVDPGRDPQGLLLDEAHLPKRVRRKRQVGPT